MSNLPEEIEERHARYACSLLAADHVSVDAIARGLSAAFGDGVRSVLKIRCVEHRHSPQRNENEANDGECGECAYAAGLAARPPAICVHCGSPGEWDVPCPCLAARPEPAQDVEDEEAERAFRVLRQLLFASGWCANRERLTPEDGQQAIDTLAEKVYASRATAPEVDHSLSAEYARSAAPEASHRLVSDDDGARFGPAPEADDFQRFAVEQQAQALEDAAKALLLTEAPHSVSLWLDLRAAALRGAG